MDRFYVDKRVGCVAVRDRNATEEYPTPGLHQDTIGVVAYWSGKRDEKTKEWTVDPDQAFMAEKLCVLLNEQDKKIQQLKDDEFDRFLLEKESS